MSKNNPQHDHPTFTVQEGYGRTREYVMDTDNILVGRDRDCNIIIEERNVSRHHASIRRTPDGIEVEDLGSANGIFVNGTPVTREKIKHLDVIQIGGAMLVFNDPDNPIIQDEDGPEITATRSIETGMLTFDFLQKIVRQLEHNIGIVFKGKPEVIRNLIVCLLADGHLLIEDVPGVGKSILAQALAKSIQAQYRRIQFTPDMLPSDITGMNIYDESSRSFKFLPGPIFGNVILADEINRTTPRTQSSLLECMSESVVTIDGRGHVLPKPFFVIATQNPEDYHGTYPLPEPQLDRFLIRLSIGYPDAASEREILGSQAASHPLNSISYVIKGSDIVHCHALVRRVKVSEKLKDYIVALSNATRLHPALANGCSPRATLALMRSAQSLAAYNGRDFVTPRDVRDMVHVVFEHRLRLKLRHQGEWQNVGRVIDAILAEVPLPAEEKII